MKKAQAALEYLLTYGWAILILIIVGAALYQLGVFNPSGLSGERKLTGFPGLSIHDWSFDGSDGSITIAFGAKSDVPVTVDHIYVTYTYTSSVSPGVMVGANEVYTRQVTGIGTATAGTNYAMNATIVYTTSDNDIEHQSSGKLFGIVE